MFAFLADRFDGAAHYHALVCASTRGEVTTRHGARDRWDWGVTVKSLGYAMRRREMLAARLAELTPEQRAQLWADDSPQAAELRRVR